MYKETLVTPRNRAQADRSVLHVGRWLAAALLLAALRPGTASGVALTNADATYSVLAKNPVIQQNMTFNGRIGVVTGGLLNLSSNTVHGRVDYAGAVNHTTSGNWSVS